uniref:Double zinc ribbon and ankyrin repeat domains 1 n=1 Tax=Gadus morhua TaxID=8049 RepID=A0A8C5FQD3_GADMO
MAAGSVAAPRLIPLRAPGHGRAGHEVDTATPVEMKSDSTDVQIFYTLDGSSPEAWRTVRGGENSTMRYSGALLLPPGKVSVKAVAVTRDGRQSSTVTKVFLVSANVTSLRGQEDLKDKYVCLSTLSEVCLTTVSLSTLPVVCLSSLSFQVYQLCILSLQVYQVYYICPGVLYLSRCTRCFCDRPSDPFSRFCVHCGASLPPVPGQRLPPTEAGQMGVCFVCNTLVPVNTPSCLICEAAIPPQLRPQARIKLKNKVLCVVCCSVNPGHISHCVTLCCYSVLLHCVVRPQTAAPPPPPAGDQRLACSQCQRTNHQDARFCDWCGAKPSHPLSSVLCGGCGASSHPYASYCSACGLLLVAPPRILPLKINAFMFPGVTATPTRARAPPTEDRQTQTVGLFYPSGAELQKSHQQRELAEQAAPRRPLLTAVSPGRGYWRQQVDHVCAHLRAYAQNNPHFRTLLGEPRMGRMATVVIKEDDFEVSLRLSFLLGGPEPPGTQVSPSSPDQTQTLSSVTEGQNPGINPTSLGEDTLPDYL